MKFTFSHVAPVCARFAVPLFALAALAGSGCVVHESVRPVYIERQPARQVVVEQPPAEPVQEVVYEPAPVEVVKVYETDLSPHGEWVVVGNYGRCWRWRGYHAGWRPYTYGHWVASDQGWLWVSEGEEAEWGATCYHYGRWYEDPAVGWVWVPGQVWAPSWCAWREGGGYSCWAPLPPECGDGHIISVAVVDRYVRADRFVSIETRNITNVHIHETIVVNNITIINKTKNITNVTYVNNRAVNKGVAISHVEKATGHKIAITHTTKVTSAEEAHREIAAGHAVIYERPEVAKFHAEHPVARKNAEAHKEAAEEHKTAVADEHKAKEAEEAKKHEAEESKKREAEAANKLKAEEAQKSKLEQAEKQKAEREAKLKADQEKKLAAEQEKKKLAEEHNKPKATAEQPQPHQNSERRSGVTEDPKKTPKATEDKKDPKKHKPGDPEDPKQPK